MRTAIATPQLHLLPCVSDGYQHQSLLTVFNSLHLDDVTRQNSQAASFDHRMMHLIGSAVGREARALRNQFEAGGAGGQLPNRTLPPPGLACFSPQINIVRDPRWGRAYGALPSLATNTP